MKGWHLKRIDELGTVITGKTPSCNQQINSIIQRRNDLLTTSRDRLLSRLMYGKIDVENLDVQFPASMKEEAVNEDQIEKAIAMKARRQKQVDFLRKVQ